MQFTLKQGDLCEVVDKLKPIAGSAHNSYSVTGLRWLLFQGQGDQLTVSAASTVGMTTTAPGQVQKAGRVVLSLAGLEYFTRPQFSGQEITFKVTTKTEQRFGRAVKETQCQAQVGETKLRVEALHHSTFMRMGDLTAKEYRPAFTTDPTLLARALKRVAGYVKKQSYSGGNELLMESVKRNQLTLLAYNGVALGVETVACITRGDVPRLALRPEGFKALISALERFTPPAPRVSLGVPERRESRVTFEVDPRGERWQVRDGADFLRFVNVSAPWPDYRRVMSGKGRKVMLPGKALAGALASLPGDAADLVTFTQRQGKPAVFEWQNYQQRDRLALEIPGMPVLKSMDVNRKMLGTVLKTFKGDQVAMLIPTEAGLPCRFTCAQDPAFTVCLARVVKAAPATPYTAAPEPQPETAEVDQDDAA